MPLRGVTAQAWRVLLPAMPLDPRVYAGSRDLGRDRSGLAGRAAVDNPQGNTQDIPQKAASTSVYVVPQTTSFPSSMPRDLVDVAAVIGVPNAS